MKRNVNLFIFVLFSFVFALFSCATTSKSQKILTIELSGNPTTGYEWVYVSSGQGHVRLVNQSYVENDNSEVFVGAGGKYIFQFQGVIKGPDKLKFEYRRPWSANDINDVAEFEVFVTKDLKISKL